jgi:hypothetical protein
MHGNRLRVSRNPHLPMPRRRAAAIRNASGVEMPIVRTSLATLAAALVAVPLVHGRDAAVKVTLDAPGHSAKIGQRWTYAVRATSAGKPVAGKLTVEIVDPLGGAHPVDFAATKKPIVNRPFKGVFRDYVLWPAEARGFPLTLRVTVVAGGVRKVIRYTVTPRS